MKKKKNHTEVKWKPSYPGQKMPQWRLWQRTDPEVCLLGFLTKEDRDAFSAGDPGPFRRIISENGKTILQNEDFKGMVRRLAYDAGIKNQIL